MKQGFLNLIATAAAAALLAAAACVTSLAAAPADYSYLSETFRYRLPWLESRTDDRGRSLSVVKDCGDHYEVTGVSFFTHTKYKEDDVRIQAFAGGKLNISGMAYTVESVTEDLSELLLVRKDGYGNASYIRLQKMTPGKGKSSYYIAVQEQAVEGSFDSGELYATGSAFLRKDCLIFPAGSAGLAESGQAAGPGEAAQMTVPEGQTMVTAEQYLTRNRADYDPAGQFRYGFNAREGLVTLCGSFTMDENGFITSIVEKE